MSIILIFLLATPVMLAASLFVETSSWWVRALARPGQAGLYVSRSNIYLYGGRFFSLAFTSMLAFWIEHGASPSGLALQIALSMAIAAVMQAVLLFAGLLRPILRVLTWSLRLPQPDTGRIDRHAVVWPLLLNTAVSAAIFGFGTGFPLLAAVLVPDYRLSVSYIGQIINSAGTLIILMMVDQKLFNSLDNGTLSHDVYSYGLGRITGFLGSALCFAVVSLILPEG